MTERFAYGVELIKAHKDDNGDWIVEGIASTPGEDHEGEDIAQEGLDYSYFLQKGFIKWEHSKNPSNFIGEPIEAKVTPQGFYIKGRLYKDAPLAKEAVRALQTLEKSKAKRKIGFSVEGSILKRDPKNPKKILKAIVRNVAMTFNPVRDTTWAALVKSLADTDALEFDLEQQCRCGHACGANCKQIHGETCTKSLDTASPSGQALQPESLEKDEDEKKKKRKARIREAFYKYLKSLLMQKSLTGSATMADEQGAFDTAVAKLSQEEADDLASYIFAKSAEINQILSGGEHSMPDLIETLDTSLDELKKALGTGTDDEKKDDKLEKSTKTDDSGGESFEDKLLESEEVQKALEISQFLEDLVGNIVESVDGFGETLQKSLTDRDNVTNALAKSMLATNELIKSMHEQITELKTAVDELANQPVGRKSVVNGREVQTLAKGLNGGDKSVKPMNRQQIVDVLVKSFEAGEINGDVVTKFEVTGKLNPDALPESVKERLGLSAAS